MIRAINIINGSSRGSATTTRIISSLRFHCGIAEAGIEIGG